MLFLQSQKLKSLLLELLLENQFFMLDKFLIFLFVGEFEL